MSPSGVSTHLEEGGPRGPLDLKGGGSKDICADTWKYIKKKGCAKRYAARSMPRAVLMWPMNEMAPIALIKGMIGIRPDGVMQ